MVGKGFFFVFLECLLILSFFSLIARLAVGQVVYVDVTVSQAKIMLYTDPSLVLLDVRNQSEYDAGHIRNAKLIPLWNLTQNLGELDKTDEILVYCAAGARSTNASSILASNGFSHIYNILEGINGWIATAYPVYVNYTSTYASYSSVQAAINNATDDRTIYVGTGFYNETLSVSRPMTLVGENARSTIITSTATVLNVEADNVSISDLTVRYTGCACFGYTSVNVTNGKNVNISDNIIISDDFGIRVVGASGAIVADNNVTHAGDVSIVVLDSSEVSVYGNDMKALSGIEIQNCTGSVFSRNAILSLDTGIFIATSYGDTFSYNNVTSTGLVGFSITSSYNNSFFDNDVYSPKYGVLIWTSYNNTIFHNNFLGNGSQVLNFKVLNNNSTNLWDDGVEGNYWSNRSGVDADLNGIGDTPYIMNPTDRDNYPLMGRFYSFSASLNQTVDVVSNSSIDDFGYVESNRTILLQVSNASANETVGFCRVRIPHSLMEPSNGSISVVVDNGQTPVLFLNSTLYDDGTSRWIYFTYQQSSHSVSIIQTVPEFPIFIVLALFMIAAVAAAAYKRNRIRCNLQISLSDYRKQIARCAKL
jgi:parallel beta-helix repeat protein